MTCIGEEFACIAFFTLAGFVLALLIFAFLASQDGSSSLSISVIPRGLEHWSGRSDLGLISKGALSGVNIKSDFTPPAA